MINVKQEIYKKGVWIGGTPIRNYAWSSDSIVFAMICKEKTWFREKIKQSLVESDRILAKLINNSKDR